MKAMILAAGFGTRLKPFSLLRPKPLFPVLNTPLLLHTLNRLKDDGFADIAVNCHHLAPLIIEALQGHGVHVFHEQTVLGTGGGLKNAEEWFADEPVLVTNGDIYHDLSFSAIMEDHKRQGNLATLVCHDFPRFNVVSLNQNKSIVQFMPCDEAHALVAFTGVHVLEPRALSIVSEGFSSIIDCYSHWQNQGETIQALMASGHFWMDMGTPADYLALHESLLKSSASPYLIHHTVDMSQVTLRDWVSVGENVVVGEGCHLERVVVWDGAVVESGACLKDTIVT